MRVTTVAVDLVRPTARAARLGVVAAGPGLGLALLGLFSLTANPVAPLLVLVGLVTAAPAGYLLDDPAAGVLSASPTTRARRHALRLALGVPVLVGGWLLLVDRATFLDGYAGLRLGDLAVEVAGFVAFTLAVATVAVRRGDEHPGATASIALVMAAAGLLVAQQALPPSWPVPLLEPGAHPGRWRGVLVVCVAALVWAGRDPWSGAGGLRGRAGSRRSAPR